jgi:O-6-methylguanine DNA methyltransferase
MNFFDRVYRETQRVPRGKVSTYSALAHRLGVPRAQRAVARALSQNHNPEVPCHRIVRADRFIGGYNGGGPVKKAALLQREGVRVLGGRIVDPSAVIW